MTENRQHDLVQLDQAFVQMRRRMDAEWSKADVHGLNAMQGRILVRLYEDGPQKASALAEQLFITPGAVTGNADKLLEMGLIDRDRAEDDRRVVILSVTDAGRELVKMFKLRRAAIMEMMFTGLSVDDIRELTRLIRQINANMDEARLKQEQR